MKVITETVDLKDGPATTGGYAYFDDQRSSVVITEQDWIELGKPDELTMQLSIPLDRQ